MLAPTAKMNYCILLLLEYYHRIPTNISNTYNVYNTLIHYGIL